MNTPLELPLEAALRSVGYVLGPRVYADQIIAQARRDDHVPGAITSGDVHLMQRSPPTLRQNPAQMTERDLDDAVAETSMRMHAIILGADLTKYQQRVVDGTVPAFLRRAIRDRWSIEYQAHPQRRWQLGENIPSRAQEIKSESLCLQYGEGEIFLLVAGKETHDRIEATFDVDDRKVLGITCQQTGANYQFWLDTLGTLNGKPFEPQPIADMVAELVGGRP